MADQRNTQEREIARRAYIKFTRRGQQHGQDQRDWLEAEQEVREEEHNPDLRNRREREYAGGQQQSHR